MRPGRCQLMTCADRVTQRLRDQLAQSIARSNRARRITDVAASGQHVELWWHPVAAGTGTDDLSGTGPVDGDHVELVLDPEQH